MREIKCRAKVKWNGNHFFAGDWVEGFYAYKELTDEHVILVERANMNRPGSYFAEAEVIPETVGQYTGLKDKNGKEIYEGDIVAFEDSDGGYEYPDVAVNTGIVKYGELRFYFTNRVAVEMDDFYIKDGRCDDVEVIGSIHENPELLEAHHE